jgi:murein endopeptidase
MSYQPKNDAQTILDARWYPKTNILILEAAAALEVDRLEFEQQALQQLFNVCYANTD